MNGRGLQGAPIAGYGVAVAAAALAFLVRLGLNDWFPPGFPYVTFFPAVVITAYFAGARPAILCAVLSMVGAGYFFSPPYNGFQPSLATTVAVAFYVFVVAVDIFFVDGMRGALRQLTAERERYAQLAESKELLYRELHHRVSNNIQVVGSLLRLQAAGVQDGDARHALSEAGGRIEVIARIQRDLHNQIGDPVPFRDFAAGLLESAKRAAGGHVQITLEGGSQPLHADQATPVTLVLLECFNNALEHGFAGTLVGKVQVTLDQDGAEHVLTVTDDGCGPPEGFDPAASRSLGLRIVRAMSGQLGGRFEMHREAGTTVSRLTYPARKD